MFHDIPKAMLDRMAALEAIDRADRGSGKSYLERLRQVPAETGKFLALIAASAPAGRYIEIGASAGYSAMWLSLACHVAGRTLTTFEVLEAKAAMASETFRLAGVDDIVELVPGDAREYLVDCRDVAFCFLDAEKDVYADCYEMVVPNLVPGGLLVADNAISHKDDLQPMLGRALTDQRVDALVVPVGNGELICRKI